jgi:hypothetical protein
LASTRSSMTEQQDPAKISVFCFFLTDSVENFSFYLNFRKIFLSFSNGFTGASRIWNSLPFFVTSDVFPFLGCQAAELRCERCFTFVKTI